VLNIPWVLFCPYIFHTFEITQMYCQNIENENIDNLDLQAPSTILLQSQTVYLHTTIDNFVLKFVVQYPIC
jgi:hypothetical protein